VSVKPSTPGFLGMKIALHYNINALFWLYEIDGLYTVATISKKNTLENQHRRQIDE